MAEPEKTQQPAHQQGPAKIEPANGVAPPAAASKSELPQVESPPLSPAGGVGAPEKIPEPEKIIPIAAAAPGSGTRAPRPFLTRRMQRNALFAACVMLAAATGAVIGALAVPHAAPPPARSDSAGKDERAAMQKSIAHLSKEISALKAGIDAATKGTGAQIGKIGDRLERIEKSDRAADATGSIGKPAAPAAVAARADAPLPVPRPNVVVTGWTLREASNGRAIVESRGEYYDVRLGDPLPGLGTVEAIKRDNGAWQVVTAKGIITGARPAATASAPVRRRSYYSPYYWPY